MRELGREAGHVMKARKRLAQEGGRKDTNKGWNDNVKGKNYSIGMMDLRNKHLLEHLSRWMH